jgi:alpha-galactosidase
MANVTLRLSRVILLWTIGLCLPSATSAEDAGKPLRIYILAGQSNMVGTGAISAIDYIGDDPATAPLLKSMLDSEGKPRTCKRVWISSLNGKYRTYGGEGVGKLSAGYGLRKDDPTQPGDCIGPEYTFGITMEESYDGPILLIKTAWGGKSLHVEYRPPSGGEYVMPDAMIAKLQQKPGALRKKQADLKKYTGKYYRYMIDHVNMVLSDIDRVCPDYDQTAGYQLAGFVWFQGWNDYVATVQYPLSDGDKQYAPYSDLLCHFIRDVRRELKTPELPFVIGVTGINGDHTPGLFNNVAKSKLRMERFRKAMTAPALLPEFQGSVTAVPTAPFWDKKLAALGMKQLKVRRMRTSLLKKSSNGPNADGSMTPAEIKNFMADYNAKIFSPEDLKLKDRASGSGGFVHYYGSAKFHAQAGQAFAKALLSSSR